MRKSPRVRRLNSDFRSVQELSNDSTVFSFESKGNPPQRYRLVFQGAGIYKQNNGQISISNRHEVIVELGAAYPRMVPNLAWHTPIFHPNISNNGVVCLGTYGTHWVPSLTLSEMATMLWDMIRYKNFDTESPYNREAAIWAKTQTDFQFPLDRRSIRDKISNPSVKEPIPQGKAVNLVNDDVSSVTPSSPTPSAGPTVSVTRVEDDSPIEILSVTDDGIEIIDAEIVSDDQPGDDGILFIT